jgi:pimeloyl-ACP methyl ester carboxylesterase
MKSPLVFFCVALLTLAGCSYLPNPYPNPVGYTVTDHQDYIDLAPTTLKADKPGLMFWPGGLVDPHAYVASLGTFAGRGYHVVIAKVTLNLAITQIGKGYELAQRLGGNWVAGGHSLGGTTAAWTVYDHKDYFKGLVLLASYPADSTPLTTWAGPVISIHGDKDGLATDPKIDAAVPELPPAETDKTLTAATPGKTLYFTLAGGNHAQWGDYGLQSGDGTATIAKEAQWDFLAQKLDDFWSTL